ncbi:hypothetical protein [Pedobacter foliorum]|uniref:hypothetical protein n=1 Tax=Pedobacter foliorum TaxID=2739058 RepID=UPI0015671D84|nr:hypothetical protein [Pedobacter foliorum]NRF40701.1 hypothetical protein [Pedobacter foliorum]
MKNKILSLTLSGVLICAVGFAQTQKNKKSNAAIKRVTPSKNTEHIGTWKLISQKITYENGQILISDSGSVFLRKILTPTNFVVIVEKKMPELNNKKLAASVSGGTYSLVNGNYQEFTKYAAFNGFEDMKINYKLTMENGKLHTIGTIGGPTIYEEFYERVEW